MSPSSALKNGQINHRDGVATYDPRAAARELTYAREEPEPPFVVDLVCALLSDLMRLIA